MHVRVRSRRSRVTSWDCKIRHQLCSNAPFDSNKWIYAAFSYIPGWFLNLSCSSVRSRPSGQFLPSPETGELVGRCCCCSEKVAKMARCVYYIVELSEVALRALTANFSRFLCSVTRLRTFRDAQLVAGKWCCPRRWRPASAHVICEEEDIGWRIGTGDGISKGCQELKKSLQVYSVGYFSFVEQYCTRIWCNCIYV